MRTKNERDRYEIVGDFSAPAAPFRRDLPSLTLAAALGGPHSFHNPPAHQIRCLPERVRRKVRVSGRRLRLCVAKQGPN